MGICQSKKVKEKEKQLINKDINGTTKEAAASQGLGSKKPRGLIQTKANKQKMGGHFQSGETSHFSPSEHSPDASEVTLQTAQAAAPCDEDKKKSSLNSVQVPTQVICKDNLSQVVFSSWSIEQQEMITQLRACDMLEAVKASRGAPTGNLHGQSQNYNIIERTCHGTDKAHNNAHQITNGKSSIAKQHDTKPRELLNHSAQMSSQPNAQVRNKEDAPQKHCSTQDTEISVVYQYCVKDKSERGRANAAKIRLRQKLEKKFKTPPGDGSKSSQQTAEETVNIFPESSKQRLYTIPEASPAMKHSDQCQIPHLNKVDFGNISPTIEKVSVETVAPHVPEVEKRYINAPNNGDTRETMTDLDIKLRLQNEFKDSQPQNTVAVKPKKKNTPKTLDKNHLTAEKKLMKKKICKKYRQIEEEKQEPAITPPVTPKRKVCGEGHWPPFTVNASCCCKARCQHNPGSGLPPNVQKWIDDCRNRTTKAPWVYHHSAHNLLSTETD